MGKKGTVPVKRDHPKNRSVVEPKLGVNDDVMIYVTAMRKYIPARIRTATNSANPYYTIMTYKRLKLVGNQESSQWHVYGLFTNSSAYFPVRPAKRTARFIKQFFKKHSGEGIVF